MSTRPLSVILAVVLTLAAVVLLYAGALTWIAVHGTTPPADVLPQFKDFALVALGALSGLLARTSTGEPGAAQPVTITNPPSDPVPTAETKP